MVDVHVRRRLLIGHRRASRDVFEALIHTCSLDVGPVKSEGILAFEDQLGTKHDVGAPFAMGILATSPSDRTPLLRSSSSTWTPSPTPLSTPAES